MTTNIIENEDFFLVYSSDTSIYHYFIFRRKYTAKDKVIDATGLVWRCSIFPTKSCSDYFNDDEIAQAVEKIKELKGKSK